MPENPVGHCGLIRGRGRGRTKKEQKENEILHSRSSGTRQATSEWSGPVRLQVAGSGLSVASGSPHSYPHSESITWSARPYSARPNAIAARRNRRLACSSGTPTRWAAISAIFRELSLNLSCCSIPHLLAAAQPERLAAPRRHFPRSPLGWTPCLRRRPRSRLRTPSGQAPAQSVSRCPRSSWLGA